MSTNKSNNNNNNDPPKDSTIVFEPVPRAIKPMDPLQAAIDASSDKGGIDPNIGTPLTFFERATSKELWTHSCFAKALGISLLTGTASAAHRYRDVRLVLPTLNRFTFVFFAAGSVVYTACRTQEKQAELEKRKAIRDSYSAAAAAVLGRSNSNGNRGNVNKPTDL